MQFNDDRKAKYLNWYGAPLFQASRANEAY